MLNGLLVNYLYNDEVARSQELRKQDEQPKQTGLLCFKKGLCYLYYILSL